MKQNENEITETIEMKKFTINAKHSKEAFVICDQQSDVLFQLGADDIIIGKNGSLSICNQPQDASFNYDGDKAVLGVVGEFMVKRIVVVQMI